MKRILSKETIKHSGKLVRVCGWVHSRRDHGKIIFIDLRDESGLVQIVFNPSNKSVYELAEKLRPEWVIGVVGKVIQRPKGMENSEIKTGQIEISAENLKVYSETKTLPFEINRKDAIVRIPKAERIVADVKKPKIITATSEEIRLRYRYLDLRREKMKKNLKLRFKVIQHIRKFLENEGFVEIETPILTKSTPEGARDFIVPSRLHPGKFYALPQSPQQYKQLLMVAGFEKYFQIARCFRDEDPRADRQMEFTQLDIEMAFIEEEDILNLIERLYIDIIKTIFPRKFITQIPFPRLIHKEVMEKYKTDKPDLRKDKSNPDELSFLFVKDFPMFEWREKENPSTGSGQGRWDACHHPFTRPQIENIKKIKKEPQNILAHQYDFVLNGWEIGGGSLRTYKPEILEAVFEVMGYKKEEAKKKFSHLFKAFQYGVPPHGGIAPGIDRFLAILCGEPNIREVIAFPKTGDGRDLMMDMPSEITKEQLEELHIKIQQEKNKEVQPP